MYYCTNSMCPHDQALARNNNDFNHDITATGVPGGALIDARMKEQQKRLARTLRKLKKARGSGGGVRSEPNRPREDSTRILGRRTAPFTPFLIPTRAPRGFYPKILVLTRGAPCLSQTRTPIDRL